MLKDRWEAPLYLRSWHVSVFDENYYRDVKWHARELKGEGGEEWKWSRERTPMKTRMRNKENTFETNLTDIRLHAQQTSLCLSSQKKKQTNKCGCPRVIAGNLWTEFSSVKRTLFFYSLQYTFHTYMYSRIPVSCSNNPALSNCCPPSFGLWNISLCPVFRLPNWVTLSRTFLLLFNYLLNSIILDNNRYVHSLMWNSVHLSSVFFIFHI